jgi:uncharacterized membrane protein
MRTPASIAGHPIHPMIVPLAIGGFVLSFLFDLMCLWKGAHPPWTIVAYWTMIGGILGALVAAVFGLVDLISLPAGPIKRTALTHMGINLAVVALYLINAVLRTGNPDQVSSPLILLSLVAILLLVVSGWLGGKLVYIYGVAVEKTTY